MIYLYWNASPLSQRLLPTWWHFVICWIKSCPKKLIWRAFVKHERETMWTHIVEIYVRNLYNVLNWSYYDTPPPKWEVRCLLQCSAHMVDTLLDTLWWWRMQASSIRSTVTLDNDLIDFIFSILKLPKTNIHIIKCISNCPFPNVC